MKYMDSNAVSRADIRHWVATEIRIMFRLNIHNVWVSSLPPILFAIASWVNHPAETRTLWSLLIAVVWAYLFIYIYDTSNQAMGVEEDRLNKPRRPAPAGLTDSAGLWRRFWVGCALFLALGLLGSPATMFFAAVWIGVSISTHMWATQRYYFLWKPVTTWIGAVCQLAGAWCVISSLTPTSIAWIVTIATMFIVAQPIEDVRDIPGDREIGRRSLATMFGGRAICFGFSLLMIVWPPLAVYLVLPQRISGVPELVAVAVLVILCLGAGLLALRYNSRPAQYAAYIVYSFIHVVLTALTLVYLLSQGTSV